MNDKKQEFERGNCTVTMSDSGCYVSVMDMETEVVQTLAVESNELLLLYMALGDALEGKI